MSQTNIALLTLSLVATSEVTTNKLVGFNGAQATTAGQLVLGVADFDAKTNETLAVVVKGTAIALTGGSIAIGDELVVDATGRVITKVTPAHHTIGRALTASPTSDSKIEILLN